MLKKSLLIASAVIPAFFAAPTHAVIVTYTDQTSFLNALNGATNFQDTFGDISIGANNSAVRTGNGFTVTYTAPPDGLYNSVGSVSTATNFDNLIATFGPGIFAAGGNFYLTDLNGNFQAFTGQTIRADASNGIDPTSILTVSTNSTSTFFGWISTTPLTGVSLNSGGAAPDRWNTIDNFIVATATSSPAPAPAAAPGPLPLFGALGALAWSRKLRQRVGTGRSSQDF
jgi:hypothetical protein